MLKTYRKTLLGLLAILLLVGGIAGYTEYKKMSDAAKARDMFSSLQGEETLTFTDLDGNPVDLEMYRGKTIVVNAWASWCPFCKDELPHLAEMAREFKDRDVVVLAINRAESRDTVRAYMNYIGNPTDIIFLLDQEDSFYKKVGGFAMPETIFYRTDGTIAGHARGSLTVEDLRTFIEQALAQTSE